MATQENRVEQAFELIQKGNEFEDSGDFWEASDAFYRAHETLQKLSENRAGGDEQQQQQDNKGHEADKICLLYQQQSVEYRARARKCFIEALRKEAQVLQKSDAQTSEGPHDSSFSLSDEEALSRIDLFAHLFSKPEVFSLQQSENGTVQEQQSSLEERLMQLNHSLPQGFKTSDERMRDINRGLNRLGLSSLYSEQRSHNLTIGDIANNKSETEQVDEIISQAKEEVALAGETTAQEANTGNSNVATGNASGYFESMLADEDEDGIDDLNDSDSNGLTGQVVESIRDKVADAQSSLAELMALLNDSKLDEEEDEDDADVLVDRASIRKSLKQARLRLLQATKQLVDS